MEKEKKQKRVVMRRMNISIDDRTDRILKKVGRGNRSNGIRLVAEYYDKTVTDTSMEDLDG
jgi:hypothetical protein